MNFRNCEFWESWTLAIVNSCHHSQPTLGTPFPLPCNFPGFFPGIFPLLTKILEFSHCFSQFFPSKLSSFSCPAGNSSCSLSYTPGEFSLWNLGFPFGEREIWEFWGIPGVFPLRNSRKIPGSQRAVEELQAPGEPRLLPGHPEKFQVGAADPRFQAFI